jgi:Concanavalin A-like lectin/glucanases superfamily
MNEWGGSTGIARERSESRYPNLWEDVQFMLIPGGGVRWVDVGGSRRSITPDANTETWRQSMPGKSHKTIGMSTTSTNTGYFISPLPWSGSSFTIAIFCQLFDTSSAFHNILTQDNQIGLWSTGGRLQLWNSSVSIGNPTAISAFTWTLWVVTATRPTAVRFYLNGKLDATGPLSPLPTYNFNCTQCDNPVGGSPFQGKIEWLAHWARPLSDTEVMSLQFGAHPLVRRRRIYIQAKAGAAAVGAKNWHYYHQMMS